MPISVDWPSKVISVPQSYLSFVGSGVYELDLDQFRLDLKSLEDDEEGMPFLDTHEHNTEVTIGGTTLARVFRIINGYTVTFEDAQYAVEAKGANSNIADVMNVNQVSLRTFNTAGLITVVSGSGLSQEEHDQLMATAVEDGGRLADVETMSERLLGLGQENFRIRDQVYDSYDPPNLTSATIRLYPSASDAVNDTNHTHEYVLVATYDGAKCTSYRVSKV